MPSPFVADRDPEGVVGRFAAGLRFGLVVEIPGERGGEAPDDGEPQAAPQPEDGRVGVAQVPDQTWAGE